MKYQWRTVTKEETHGGVEVWVHGNQDSKAQVPSQSHGVDPQKQHKEGNLPLWRLWKSPKDETGHHADIPSRGHLSSLRCLQSPKTRFLGQRKSRWRNHLVPSWKHRCPRARRDSGRQMSYAHPMQKSPLQHLLGLSKRLLPPWSDSPVYAEVTGPRRDWHFFFKFFLETGIFALPGSSPSLSMSRLHQRRLLIARGLSTSTFFFQLIQALWLD